MNRIGGIGPGLALFRTSCEIGVVVKLELFDRIPGQGSALQDPGVAREACAPRGPSERLDIFEGQDVGIVLDPDGSAGRVDGGYEETECRRGRYAYDTEKDRRPFPFEKDVPVVLDLGDEPSLVSFDASGAIFGILRVRDSSGHDDDIALFEHDVGDLASDHSLQIHVDLHLFARRSVLAFDHDLGLLGPFGGAPAWAMAWRSVIFFELRYGMTPGF